MLNPSSTPIKLSQPAWQYSLRSRVLLLALVPMILLTTLYAIFNTSSYYRTLLSALIEHSSAITLQTNLASRYGLLINNIKLLRQIASSAKEDPSISSVTIFDQQDRQLVSSGLPKLNQVILDKLKKALGPIKADQVIHLKAGNLFLMISPIVLPDHNDKPPKVVDKNHLLGYVVTVVDPQAEHQALMGAFFELLPLLFLGLLATGAAGWRLSRQIVQPISSMLTTVIAVQQGKLAELTPNSSIEEINALSLGLHQMANVVHQNRETMQKNINEATASLRNTLQTLQEKNQELQEARLAAEKAVWVRNQFLANISHEIRTPLSGVLGFASLLTNHLQDIQLRNWALTIEMQAKSLMQMLNEILDFTQMESGIIHFESKPFDFLEIFDFVIANYAATAQIRQIEMVMLIDQHLPSQFIGDQLRITQIINNLLHNALKFTETGFVYLHLTGTPCANKIWQLELSVKDSGCGIAKADQEQLFRPYQQIPQKKKTFQGGTGLGLAICQRLVHQMGGNIAVNSEPEHGSTFTISWKAEQASDSSHFTSSSEIINVYVLEPKLLSRQFILQALERYGFIPIVINHVDDWCMRPNPDINDVLMINPEQCGPAEPCQLSTSFGKIIDLIHSNGLDLSHLPHQHEKEYILRMPATFKQLQELLLCRSNKSYHILVVDDHTANRQLIEAMAKQIGLQVCDASDGEMALKMVIQYHFDLILMDWRMPGINGLETAKLIHQQLKDKGYCPPIIALTAQTENTIEHSQHYQPWFAEVVQKPMSFIKLKQLIDKYIVQQEEDSSPKTENLDPHANEPEFILDTEHLLQHYGNHQFVVKELIEAALRTVESDWLEAQNLFDHKQWCSLADWLHRMRSTAKMLLLPTYDILLQQMEQDAVQHNGRQLQKKWGKLNRMMKSLMKQLKNWQELPL